MTEFPVDETVEEVIAIGYGKMPIRSSSSPPRLSKYNVENYFSVLNDFLNEEESVAASHPKKKRKYTKKSNKPPATSEEDIQRNVREIEQCTDGEQKPKKKSGQPRPRWWNQTYLLYLVLRKAARPLSRREIAQEALRLDLEISRERNLPKCFGGKTPMNTASRVLTENRDKIFHQVWTEGSKKMYFQLSYEPDNFDKAVEEYNGWMAKLIELDWPILFGHHEGLWQPMDKGILEQGQIEIEPLKTNKNGASSGDKSRSSNKDDANIPTCLEEVVEVRTSTIPNSGRGLFALRDIPKFTYLGFYFGVPMTEDDFESLKEAKGQASEYSHRYRKTVLDATDENGMPFVDHPKIFCPFHFMNEDIQRANMAFVEGYIVNQVLCMSTRKIFEGEELFVKYGDEVDRGRW